MNKAAFSPRLPSLDGWRAISILMVLGAHTGYIVSSSMQHSFRWEDGTLGVRCFFIISGFLITWLMLLERAQTGTVSLKHFYIRRCLRILPVYGAFLIVLFGFQLLTPFRERNVTWIALLTFTRNYIEGTMASGHFWSLSVEEQFYLIWPTVFLYFCARKTIKSAAYILVVPILSAPFFRALGYVSNYPAHLMRIDSGLLQQLFKSVSFFDNYDSLAFGCLAALLLFTRYEILEKRFQEKPLSVTWIAGGLVLFPYIADRLGIPVWIKVPFLDTLEAICFSMLILQSVIEPRLWIYRALNWRWVRQIGVLSYSLYVWQQIFWVRPWLGGDVPKTTSIWWVWCWLLPTFAVAFTSYYGLERPLFKLRSRFRDVNISAQVEVRPVASAILSFEKPRPPLPSAPSSNIDEDS